MKIRLLLTATVLLSGVVNASDLSRQGRCSDVPAAEQLDCDQRLNLDGKPVDENSSGPNPVPTGPEGGDLTAAADDRESLVSSLGSAISGRDRQIIAVPPATPDGSLEAGRSVATVSSKNWTAVPDSDWEKNLPNLDGTLPGSEEKRRRSVITAPRITPVPEKISLPDFEARLSSRQGANDQLVATASPGTVAAQNLPVDRTPAAISAAGFVLQLAAFAELSDLEQFVVEQDLQSFPLERGYLQSRGNSWHVLWFGRFSTYQAARKAGEKLLVARPRLNYWVRSVDSLAGNHSQLKPVTAADRVGQ